MSRKPCCVGDGIKKGAWTIEEDKKLTDYVNHHGEGGWRYMPQKAGLQRCGKSCRLRWINYLKPEIKRGGFSSDEEQIIIMLHASRGNKWSVIASHLPRRTDNDIKNYWNTHLKKRLIEQGIDPVTHKPLANSAVITSPENSQSLDGSSSDRIKHSGSSSRLSLSNPPGFNNTVSSKLSEISNNEVTLEQSGFLSCKKASSTSKLLNKVARKANSVRELLSASLEGSNASFFNGFSNPIRNEEDSSNVSLRNSTLYEVDPMYLDHDATSDLGKNQQGFDFSNFLEGDNSMNVEYGQDLLLISDVSQEAPSTSVDDQYNMTGDFEGWSNYLLDHTDFLYDTDSDSLEKQFL